MKNLRLLVLCSVLFAATVSLSGQLAGTLSGPALGFIWNPDDRQIHPLLGIPGSATVGPGIHTGISIRDAHAINGRQFLATTETSETLVFVTITGSVTAVPIAGAPAHPDRIVASRGGTSAALYYDNEQSIRVVTGLPGTPAVYNVIDLSGETGSLTAMAVNDNGSSILFSKHRGTADTLYAWSRLKGSRVAAIADSISAVALNAAGDVIVADNAKNEVFSVHDPLGIAARTPLADSRYGIDNPVAVAIAQDGNIHIANAGAKTVTTLDAAGRYLRTTPCDCAVSLLLPLKDSLYRISPGTDATIYVLQASASKDRIVFIPPLGAHE